MAKILIVDDHLPFRAVFAETITGMKHEVLEAGTGEEALAMLRSTTPHLVFLDLRLPDITGLEVLQGIREIPHCKTLPVIILTAYADSSNTIAAMKLGAFDHLTKPIGKDALQEVINRGLESKQVLEADGEKLLNTELEDKLIGASAAFRIVEKSIGMCLANNISVLLIGETGTGKETIARIIHQNSDKAGAKFCVVPCSSPSLEFDEWMSQGTIFLDEIADLNPSDQARLLNLLREEESGLAVIASTRFEPNELAEKGLREDLFYRLSAFPILIPPLRARDSDVLVLAEAFIARQCPGMTKRLTPAASRALLEYPWPGNVRELQNVIRRACIVSRGASVDVKDLTFALPSTQADQSLGDLLQLDYYSAIASLEKQLLERTLKNSTGNRAEAARALGINRQLLYAKLKEHGLD